MPVSPITDATGVVTVVIKVKGTPLADSYQVLRARVDLDSTRPSMFELTFVTPWDMTMDGRGTSPAKIGDEIEVGAGYDGNSTTLIKGEVTALEAHFGSTADRVVVRGFDKG